ncbi:MAG: hypothetical protein CBD26_03550 [Candidatus Pelagibacter sp. TMED166]|nr:MAG: hypothetical protein CBD26_03550 [Candidatus Pelagibacter sp. TMED166]|tara:strand:+ start:3084 stop:3386 length:303 start_codon:yes stop_codon:yes gene_type:complete
MKDIEQFIDRINQNITEDRAATKTLLASLMKYMMVSEDRHKEVGIVAAKYLETLQRSNEQLVKTAALLQKQRSNDTSISDEERDELFDLIQENSQSKAKP